MTLTSFLALFWQRSQENKLTQAAGSLTYSTMLAIVPLIMVVFSIFSAFPVFNEVTGALKEFMEKNGLSAQVSITDEADYAVAFVLVEQGEAGK